MVSDKSDIPPRDEVQPDLPDSKINLAKEIAATGEAEIHLRGREEPAEVHAYDSYFFAGRGLIYTEGYTDEDDDDVWIFAEDISYISRH